MPTKYEYDARTRKDRAELVREIERAEDEGWELVTITESIAWFGVGGPPADASQLFTAWLRQPRRKS